jgi:indole-3-acetate monooxygenase
MWMPRADVELHDTWHALGLRGSGSGDISANDVTVPVDRTVSLMTDRPRISSPLYRFPAFGLLSLGIAGVCIGIAEGATDGLLDLAGAKVPSGMRRTLAERGHTQAEVARVAGAVASARAFLVEAAGQAWRVAEAGDALSLRDRAQIRIAASHAVQSCAAAVRAVHDLAGGSAVYEGSGLERRFRDMHTATQHVMIGHASLELAGRALLGIEGDYSQL